MTRIDRGPPPSRATAGSPDTRAPGGRPRRRASTGSAPCRDRSVALRIDNTAWLQLGESLLVVAEVARVRDGVVHHPPDDALLVDDERPALRRTERLVEDAVRLRHFPVRPVVRQQ